MCDVEQFHCSVYYPQIRKYILNKDWYVIPMEDLVANPPDKPIFIRPDSPLKEFSGRVLSPENITLKGLDHGFYYEDSSLPVLVSSPKLITSERRFVIHEQKVITGTFQGKPITRSDPYWEFAAAVASDLVIYDPLYVMDTCEHLDKCAPKVVELNPFSGADLTGCDLVVILETLKSLT